MQKLVLSIIPYVIVIVIVTWQEDNYQNIFYVCNLFVDDGNPGAHSSHDIALNMALFHICVSEKS